MTAPIPMSDTLVAERPSLLALAGAFARVSVSSFGGGNSAWIQRELVERRRWLSPDEFIAGYALCQILPGGTTVNVATFCGTKLRGTWGALAACGGIIFPPLLLVLTLGAFYTLYGKTESVQHVLAGVGAAAIGLTLQLGISSGRRGCRDRRDRIVAALIIVTVGWLRWPILPVILVMSPLSIYWAYRRRGDS